MDNDVDMHTGTDVDVEVTVVHKAAVDRLTEERPASVEAGGLLVDHVDLEDRPVWKRSFLTV
jgi:hypothetical protein